MDAKSEQKCLFSLLRPLPQIFFVKKERKGVSEIKYSAKP